MVVTTHWWRKGLACPEPLASTVSNFQPSGPQLIGCCYLHSGLAFFTSQSQVSLLQQWPLDMLKSAFHPSWTSFNLVKGQIHSWDQPSQQPQPENQYPSNEAWRSWCYLLVASGTGEMDQWVKTLATKPDDLSLILGAYMAGRVNNSSKLSSSSHMKTFRPGFCVETYSFSRGWQLILVNHSPPNLRVLTPSLSVFFCISTMSF